MSLISITTDIASIAIEGKRSEDKVLKLAHYDELTDLPNRFQYNQHLAKSLAHAERNKSQLAVLFLDLDRFKNINDTFGHDEGDKVLSNVALRFTSCLRESDTIARVGGDEFILLVGQYSTPKDLADIADKLLIAAALPFDIYGQECQLSASIGIATFPDDGRDAQTLMKNADIAMYRAKNKGKDNYQFYASEMNVHTIERLAFEARLRRALERREFVVYYQPKIDVNSGQIVGAEALVRWNHPERGILLPGEFISLAEEAGLIGRIGMLVLDIACRDITAFITADKNFGRVAIKLSGAQFNDVQLLADVNSVVDFWRIDPSNIEFEITESMVMHNRDQAIILMDGLKSAGLTLSIDDFGTGYSSLAYLKRFPVDSVKIDRSFIKDMPDDPNDTAIVLAIVAMAYTLGLKVISEGVESELQLQTLVESRCNQYQGFYFSKVIFESEFLAMLEKQAKASLF
ncbi:MAG: EAL domain-containing protein [Cytophaga sp.]|nr:EAL domain-containing protein [Undibacterium sp.]